MANNFFDLLERGKLNVGATSAKKRNKNNAKSYNKMDQYDNAVDISSYINNLNYSTNMG